MNNNSIYPLSEIQELIHSEIEKERKGWMDTQPGNLYLPVRYILGQKGKKLRSSLVLLSYNLFNEKVQKALPVALAIEVFHNFTLLHDDIMDKAEIRRNKPAVHKKFGENAAILSGDVMSFISFKYLLKCEPVYLKALLELFTDTAIAVCEGQQYDLDFENRFDVSEKEYLEMIRLKTAVLLACSLQSGSLLAGAGKQEMVALYNLGINLGMAFQLQDDLLDSFGEEPIFGKKIGGDILANKKTFLLIKALELAAPKRKKELINWINKKEYNPEEKIKTIQSFYTDLDLEARIKEKTAFYYDKVHSDLASVSVDESQKGELKELIGAMLHRSS
jgi:geranylgeranyl diphosphate synthase, type II